LGGSKINKLASRQIFTKIRLSFLARVTLGAVFFIVGFNFSNSTYFHEFPLFGIPFLAEALISLVAGAFGFHTLPIVLNKTRHWLEDLIAKIISSIVSDFWDQQTKRMQQARRAKQKAKNKKSEKKLKEKLSRGVLLDTSVLVDGRIIDIVRTGFLDSPLIVPQSVIHELHLISDNEDLLKRQRGRRGLDILKELKKEAKVMMLQQQSAPNENNDVDSALVGLAKKYKINLMTMDFNLNKVAAVSNIKVLNINELLNAVKSVVLPGEHIGVKVSQKGKEAGQGVAYLADGTMVVVAGAQGFLGKTVDVTVSKVIQTHAGRMVFGELSSS